MFLTSSEKFFHQKLQEVRHFRNYLRDGNLIKLQIAILKNQPILLSLTDSDFQYLEEKSDIPKYKACYDFLKTAKKVSELANYLDKTDISHEINNANFEEVKEEINIKSKKYNEENIFSTLSMFEFSSNSAKQSVIINNLTEKFGALFTLEQDSLSFFKDSLLIKLDSALPNKRFDQIQDVIINLKKEKVINPAYVLPDKSKALNGNILSITIPFKYIANDELTKLSKELEVLLNQVSASSYSP